MTRERIDAEMQQNPRSRSRLSSLIGGGRWEVGPVGVQG